MPRFYSYNTVYLLILNSMLHCFVRACKVHHLSRITTPAPVSNGNLIGRIDDSEASFDMPQVKFHHLLTELTLAR